MVELKDSALVSSLLLLVLRLIERMAVVCTDLSLSGLLPQVSQTHNKGACRFSQGLKEA